MAWGRRTTWVLEFRNKLGNTARTHLKKKGGRGSNGSVGKGSGCQARHMSSGPHPHSRRKDPTHESCILTATHTVAKSINKCKKKLLKKKNNNKKPLSLFRFEMPYNIWCDGCKNHIGMGERGWAPPWVSMGERRPPHLPCPPLQPPLCQMLWDTGDVANPKDKSEVAGTQAREQWEG